MAKSSGSGFVDFMKNQGIVGMAVGLIIGLAAVEMINRMFSALITPIISAVFGEANIEDSLIVNVGDAQLRFGDALDALFQFVILAFFVYMAIKLLGADKWDVPEK